MFLKGRKEGARLEQAHKNEYQLDCATQNHLSYFDLYRPWGDGDADFSSICIDITKRFLAKLDVITHVYAFDFANACKDDYKNCFAYQFYFQNKGQTENAKLFANTSGELISVSKGINETLMKDLTSGAAKGIWQNDCRMYGYDSLNCGLTSFEEAKKAIDAIESSIVINYQEQQDILSIVTSIENANADKRVSYIKDICASYGKALRIEV